MEWEISWEAKRFFGRRKVEIFIERQGRFANELEAAGAGRGAEAICPAF